MKNDIQHGVKNVQKICLAEDIFGYFFLLDCVEKGEIVIAVVRMDHFMDYTQFLI